MSQQDPIRIFVTHCWQDSDDYQRVFEYVESNPNFFYRNSSTPDKPPTSGDTEVVREDLRKQINQAEMVIALAGLYSEQPDLTIFQMNYAKSQRKPVLLLPPFGSRAELPKLLTDRADESTGWEKRGLIDAIKRLARHENTARYDTIEFNAEEFKHFKLE
jgi:antiphage defense system Thoeris ThsB-like protein